MTSAAYADGRRWQSITQGRSRTNTEKTMAKDKSYPLFSNGTEFMLWTDRNCEKCVKAVFYDEKKDRWPKYRCAIQAHIEEAAITDGRGNKRDHEATHTYDCPHKQTERKPRKIKPRKIKKDPNQLMLDL